MVTWIIEANGASCESHFKGKFAPSQQSAHIGVDIIYYRITKGVDQSGHHSFISFNENGLPKYANYLP
jgi:hypothetical protein